MAGSRRRRGDRSIRIAIGLAIVTVAAIPMIATWTETGRTDPWRLFGTAGWWVGIVVAVGGLLLLGSSLPSFHEPGLRITVGNDDTFHIHKHPEELDLQMADEMDFHKVDVRITRVRVVETRGRFAEKVRIEVIGVNPAHRTHPDQVEYLSWWTRGENNEFEEISPNGTKWAILHTNVVNKGNWGKSTHYGLTDTDPYSALLAVTCNGKLMDAVEIKVEGSLGLLHGKPESGFATVTVINRPSIKDVHDLVKKRSLQRV